MSITKHKPLGKHTERGKHAMPEKYTVLTLSYVFGGDTQRLFLTVLFGERDTVLVDCGYPGSLEMIENALRARGVEPASITGLVLTHQDDDHMGAAAELKEKYPSVKIYASALEEPYISGKRKNLRLEQAEALQSLLPEEQKPWGERFCARLQALRPVAVDVKLRHGDMFDWGGGCEIIHTPGHTPGHISLRALNDEFVICGDAAVAEAGALAIANPQFCLDPEAAEKSLALLRGLSCRRYICCHGGSLDVS